jgi:hypothetical protein
MQSMRALLIVAPPAERLEVLRRLLGKIMGFASELAHEPGEWSVGAGDIPEAHRRIARDVMTILYPVDVALLPYLKSVIGPVLSGARLGTKRLMDRNPEAAAFIRDRAPERDLRAAVLRRVRRGTTCSELAPILRVFLLARGAWLSKGVVEERIATTHPLDAEIARRIGHGGAAGSIHVIAEVAHRTSPPRGRRGRVRGEQSCRCSECVTDRIVRRAAKVLALE